MQRLTTVTVLDTLQELARKAVAADENNPHKTGQPEIETTEKQVMEDQSRDNCLVERFIQAAKECRRASQAWPAGSMSDEEFLSIRNRGGILATGPQPEELRSRMPEVARGAEQAVKELRHAVDALSPISSAIVRLRRASIGADDLGLLRRATVKTIRDTRLIEPWIAFPAYP